MATITDNELKGWLFSMKPVLGALDDTRGKVSSISYAPDQLRKMREKAYVPKVVSIGPLHRGNRELLYMEEIKWRCMLSLLLRTEYPKESFQNCGNAIFQLDALVRAAYTNDIKLNSSELAKIMLLDGCFLLELLISNDEELDKRFRNPDKVKTPVAVELVLPDLKLLENQIPVFILAKLFQTLFFPTMVKDLDYQRFQQTVNTIALSLFACSSKSRAEDKSTPKVDSPEAKETDGCVHFLDLIHMFMTRKEENNDHHSIAMNENQTENFNDSRSTESKQTLQLKCCAARLEAAGVKIVALEKKASMSRLENIKFIEDNGQKKLVIQRLHITETEEVQWWNLIAWEQNRTIPKKFLRGSENVTRCRFSQYALLFKDLVCCEHDIQLLKDRGVLLVDDGKKRSNKDLMTLFQEMAKGIDVDLSGDGSYRQLLEELNKCSGTKWNRKILLHHSESFKAKTGYMCRDLLEILKCDYTPNVWKTLGVIAAITALGLTIAQTILAAISL